MQLPAAHRSLAVKSVVIKGDLSASEGLTLHGQMKGSVTLSNHTLTIGPGANIKASISAKGRGDHGRSHRQRDGWRESRDSSHGLDHWRSRGAAPRGRRSRPPSRQSRDAADRFPSQFSDLMQRSTNS